MNLFLNSIGIGEKNYCNLFTSFDRQKLPQWSKKNFIDNYSWTKYILNVAKNSKNFNWIIKRHPSEEFYSSKKKILTLKLNF